MHYVVVLPASQHDARLWMDIMEYNVPIDQCHVVSHPLRGVSLSPLVKLDSVKSVERAGSATVML